MPRAEEEAYQASKREDGSFDHDAFMAHYQKGLAERQSRLMHDARAVFRAMDGWTTVESKEQWDQTVTDADEAFRTGRFLIDRLGAERYLDPTLMAVLLAVRRRLIEEHDATGSADLMLIDSAVIAYYHSLRINGWIGNFASLIEHEFFQKESPSAKFQDRHGRGSHKIRGLQVEDHVERIAEQLLPLVERFNAMMLRNLDAVRSRRVRKPERVDSERVGQLNIGLIQINNAVESIGRTGAETKE